MGAHLRNLAVNWRGESDVAISYTTAPEVGCDSEPYGVAWMFDDPRHVEPEPTEDEDDAVYRQIVSDIERWQTDLPPAVPEQVTGTKGVGR